MIFTTIEALFEAAKKHNLLWELEELSRRKTLEAAKEFIKPPFLKKLFMNVYSETIENKKFNQELLRFFMKEYHIAPQNILFKVADKVMVQETNGATTSISQYYNHNIRFLIGEMQDDFSQLEAIHPTDAHFIKIDMQLIRDIDRYDLKGLLVKSLVEYAKTTGLALIAEGIETEEEFEAVLNLGVQYGQGYYIQKPYETIQPIRHQLKEKIQILNRINVQKASNHVLYTPIKELVSSTQVIPPSTTVLKAYELINDQPYQTGLVVVDNGKPIGVVSKETLAFRLSGRYGFNLYQDKPITKVMKREFLAVDVNMPVNLVGEMAMDRPADAIYDFIVVTKAEKYYGIVTIKTMLRKTIDLKVRSAKQENPLTGLPGNGIIAEKITQLIESDKEYSVSYLDIDHFKSFNDNYGFESGDAIIKLLAATITKHLPDNAFIGHIGGDDLVVIFDRHIPDNYFQPIIDIFEQKAHAFYNLEDRERGYVVAQNRLGVTDEYPLLSLTAVTLSNEDFEFSHVFELSEKLSQLKTKVKSLK